MRSWSRRKRVRYAAAVVLGVTAGVSRLNVLPTQPVVGYLGLLAGAVVGAWSSEHRPVYHDAVGAATSGTFLYVVVLAVGARLGQYTALYESKMPAFSAIGPLLEPLLFLPLFVVESLVAAVVVKAVRTRASGLVGGRDA